MKAKVGIWDQLSRLALLLLFLLGLVGVFFWYLPLIKQNQRYRQRIMLLEAQIEKQEHFNRQLKSSIEAVQQDPQTVERAAREVLGYARTNEMVVIFEEPKSSRASLP